MELLAACRRVLPYVLATGAAQAINACQDQVTSVIAVLAWMIIGVHKSSEAQRAKCSAAAPQETACAPQNKTMDDAWAVDLMNPFNITGNSSYFPLAAPGLHVFGEQAKENFYGNQGMVRRPLFRLLHSALRLACWQPCIQHA